MELTPLISVLAAAGNLLVFFLVVALREHAPGRRPLALLCLSLALWNLGEVFGPPFDYCSLAGAALVPALMLNFVLRFLGRERKHLTLLIPLYLVSLVFFAVTLLAYRPGRLRDFVDGPPWNITYMLLLLPFAMWAVWQLYHAHRAERRRRRKLAIRYVLLAAAVGLSTGISDLLIVFGTGMPRVGALGSFLCMGLLCYAILKFHLMDIHVALWRLAVLLVLAALPPLAFYWVVAAPGRQIVVVAATSFVALGVAVWAISRWQEQAEQKRRLAELGEVSALMAHEIRNPLAAIKGAAQFLQGEIRQAPATEYISLLLEEIERLNAAVSDVQYFVRPVEIEGHPTDLNRLVEALVRRQEAGAPSGVKLETRLAGELPPVHGDPRLISQVLLNLVKNAIEAVGESGVVRIETHPAHNGAVTVAVRDTGPGISEQVATRLFDPYVTTKTRGLGLGLALSRRIAEAHGGTLKVGHPEGGGAEFRLELPVSQE